MATHPAAPLSIDCCPPVGEGRLTEADAEALATRFAALADPVRLRLFGIIAAGDAEGVCACDLTEPVGRSQPTVSHHLKVLREAGLVTGEKRGTWVHYRPDAATLAALRHALR